MATTTFSSKKGTEVLCTHRVAQSPSAVFYSRDGVLPHVILENNLQCDNHNLHTNHARKRSCQRNVSTSHVIVTCNSDGRSSPPSC